MAATKISKRKAALDRSIDQYCHEVESVLTQIYKRIEENPSRNKRRGRKKKKLEQ